MGDRKGIRGRKGAGLTNLLGGVAKCVCGANMRLIRKGSHNNYLYLQCSDAKQGKCEHRKLHRYQPIEAEMQRNLGEIAFGRAPPDDTQVALRARIAHAKSEAAGIEICYNRESEAIGKGKDAGLGAKRLATLDYEHGEKLAEIAELEKQLQPAKPIDDEQITAARRLIARLGRLPARERFPIRSKINAGLRALVRGGIIISPTGDITVNLSPAGGPGPTRHISDAPTMPDGAIELRTPDEVLAAVKAGYHVRMTSPR